MSCDCGVCEGCTSVIAPAKGLWRKKLVDRMTKQVVDRFMRENRPMVMPPKPVTIAVKKALGIPVYAFFRYPLPPAPGSPMFENTYERIA